MTTSFDSPVADHVAEPVHVPIGHHQWLPGTLALPPNPYGVVVFAHGSGSSRLSPRNRFVADRLFDANVGWLLFDLLTDTEAESRANVFDIQLLAERLRQATTGSLTRPPGLTARCSGEHRSRRRLVAAARDPASPSSCRAGRPDLAGDLLRQVHAPTLLIVGGADSEVLG
jgi:putative phosphoribosyl transferase